MSGRGKADAEWVERYEALRAHATGEAPLGFVPLGLALLRHRGVVAWMAAESSGTGPALLGPADRDRGRPSRRVGLDASRSELVRLLASTALLAVQGRAS